MPDADLEIMRPRAILVVSALFVSVLAASSSATARTHEGAGLRALDTLETGVLVEINAFRRSRGLHPVRLSSSLARAADAHSAAMAARGFFAHESADGSAFWKRVLRYYPKRSRTWSVGENILWSSPNVDPAGALRTWMQSPAHRKILLTPRWREVGLSAVHSRSAPGVYGGLEVTVLTADFGTR